MLTDNPSYSSVVETNNNEVDNSAKSKKRGSRTIFGSYQLLRTIGEGEFGKVKLGIKINTQRAVAIKLIKKKSVYNQNKLTKLCQEISILEKVNHPYIIKTYEVIEDNDYIGIIMEYASGGELFEYILAHRYLEEYESKRFFAQLLSGINYLHKNHLVHRDLKLENLLLDSIHNIVITDFGFATESHSDENKFLTTSCGSPCYAAPELVVNDGYVGEAADIWSCGVILYAMICGYLPFDDDPNNPDGENIHLLYKYILETEVTFPDYVSEEAKDLLRGILNPDPETRFTMEQIINHPWIRDFKEFILLEYDENNEAIIPEPDYDEIPNDMRIMVDSNQDNNVKTLASQVFSSVSSNTQQDLNSPMAVDSHVPDSQEGDDDEDESDDEDTDDESNDNDSDDTDDDDDDDDDDDEDDDEDDEDEDDDVNADGYYMESKNNVLQDISTIDSDQYIDFIKQSDCDTTTSNAINSEISDFSRPTIFKKDSYYTAQSMDLNQSSVTTKDSHDNVLDIPMNIAVPINNNHYGDNLTIPDSISNYYTDHSEVFSLPPSSQIPQKLVNKSSSDEDNFLEQSNKTIKDNSNNKKNVDEVSSVNNQSNTSISSTPIKPKPRNSSLPVNNNLVKTNVDEKSDDRESSIFSQTVIEAPTKTSEISEIIDGKDEKLSGKKINNSNNNNNNNSNNNNNNDNDDDDDDKNKKIDADEHKESQCLSKLENLSIDNSKDYSFIKDDGKSIRSDRKSIRSRKDLSHMNLENIKVARSNISLSSRKRLSVCTTSTMNTLSSTPFYTPSSGKHLSSVNTSFNDFYLDSPHPLAGHTSLIIANNDSSIDMKRYSLNAYRQSRHNLNSPSIVNSFTTNTSNIIYKNSIVKNDSVINKENNKLDSTSQSKPPIPSFILKDNNKQNNDNENDNNDDNNNTSIMILNELKDDKHSSIIKPIDVADLQLNDAESSSSNSEISDHHHSKTKTEAVTEATTPHATEAVVFDEHEQKVKINEEANIAVSITNIDDSTQVKTSEKELISPKNPYIKFFNGIIDSKALTITPPFVTFLEIQKTLIDMNIDYRVLNNCFKIRCQKVFNTIDTPEDLEAIGKASPAISPLHSPVQTSTTPSSSPPPLVRGKSAATTISTSSNRKGKIDNDQVSKCYSFYSHGSGKFKSLMTSIIDCAKPSLPAANSSSPTTLNRSGSDIHQNRLFSLIKRKKNQSLVIFTMEICRIKNRDELYIIKFKRRKGDVWLFKDLYQQILSRLPLRT